MCTAVSQSAITRFKFTFNDLHIFCSFKKTDVYSATVLFVIKTKTAPTLYKYFKEIYNIYKNINNDDNEL